MRDHDERRRRLVSNLTGTVVEIGAGTGLTFPDYPRTVSSVVAVEPDARRRAAASGAAGNAPVPIVVARVLRPLGELRFLEHVIAERGALRVLQRLVAPVYPRLPTGCHIDNDTVESIARAGFSIERSERFMQVAAVLGPAIPHVMGTARKNG